MQEGWIKVHRKLLKHEVWQNSKFFCVWMYVLLHVNHEEKRMLWNGKKIIIPRGGGIISQKKIAKHFDISRDTVQRALAYFKDELMIDIKTTNKFTYVQVKNYEKYQEVGTKSASNRHQVGTNKNEKNEKKQTSVSVDNLKQPNTVTDKEKFIEEYYRRRKDGWRAVSGNDLVCISAGEVRLKIHSGEFVNFNESLSNIIWVK